MVVLAGGPGDVPAVQHRLHDEHGAHVGGLGGVAHDVQLALPGLGLGPGRHGLGQLGLVVGDVVGFGGEVLAHQVLGDALAVGAALGGVRGPQDRVVEQGAQIPVGAGGGGFQRGSGGAGDHAGRFGRGGRHQRGAIAGFLDRIHPYTLARTALWTLNKRDSYAGHVPDSRVAGGVAAGSGAGAALPGPPGAMGRGVLRPGLAAERFTLARFPSSGPLEPFVDFYWIIRWDLRGQPPHEQTILPHPNVNLAFEASGAGIYGVDRSLFVRRLDGQGKALGVRFRAGCFRPFWGAPVSQLSDRVVPAHPGVRAAGGEDQAGRHVRRPRRRHGLPRRIHALLRAARTRPGGGAGRCAGGADHLGLRAAAGGPAGRRFRPVGPGLQRLFADYVGVGPKWVMRRARLHEASERAGSGEPVDWAALAADLGYADQAHLTRDFTATIGVPPSRYQAGP